MPRAPQHAVSIVLQIFQAVLSEGPVHIPGLAEPAPADTATLNFQHHPVLGHFDKWHQRLFNISHTVHVRYNLFGNHRHGMFIIRQKTFNGTVFLIGHIIKSRHIDSRYLRRHFQKLLSGAASLLILLVAVHQLKIYGFALSDIKQVKKVSQRFRIICAGPASDNNGVILRSVACMERNL